MTTTKHTAADVAKFFGVPLTNAKALYARNAVMLRDEQAKAEKSKSGKIRGLTADWYHKAADHAELQSK